MKREIKFRFWQTIEKFMLNWDEINLSSLYELLTAADSIPMQFTGLTDKNGKEIYEGDYLSIGANELGEITNKKGEKVKYEVRHEECDYILFRTDIELIWGRLSRLSEMCWNCEVIGNIYETKL